MESKSRPLHRVIFALGIPRVGEQTAKILADKFGDLRKLMNASYDELVSIKDIGPETATEIVKFFKDENNKKLVEELLALGVGTSNSTSKRDFGPLFRRMR